MNDVHVENIHRSFYFVNAFFSNTIPVNKHNNTINKIPSNGYLKIYLHESVKTLMKIQSPDTFIWLQ